MSKNANIEAKFVDTASTERKAVVSIDGDPLNVLELIRQIIIFIPLMKINRVLPLSNETIEKTAEILALIDKELRKENEYKDKIHYRY